MEKSNFTFSCKLRVRWAEVDKQGIVFNPHYAMYFDVGVTEYYKSIGFPYNGPFEESGADIFAKKLEVVFHSSAEYDDLLNIFVRTSKIGFSSFVLSFEIYKQETLIVNGSIVNVVANPNSKKSEEIPYRFKEAILNFEKKKPDQKK